MNELGLLNLVMKVLLCSPFKGEENEMQRFRETAPGLDLASALSGDGRHCYFASNIEESLDF